MRYRILGPLAVEVAGAPLRIRSGRVATLLATLLLEVNRTVPTERLIEAVWDWNAPPTARSQLTIVVSQLRRLLAEEGVPSPVITDTAGYRLSASTDEVDALLFARRVGDAERAAASGRTAEAVEDLRAALDLWRGPALAGLDGRVVQTAATLLTERRAAVQARRIDWEFALGRHDRLVTELVGLVASDPLNERLRTGLVIALYRSGRVTDALDAFAEFRRRLAEEVGIEPGPQLAALHRQILNRDPALDPPVGTVAPVGTVPPPAPASPSAPALPAPPADTGPGPRPAGPPGHRRAGGRPRYRPGRRRGRQPGGPSHRRPGGRDGTAVPQRAGWSGEGLPRLAPADPMAAAPDRPTVPRQSATAVAGTTANLDSSTPPRHSTPTSDRPLPTSRAEAQPVSAGLLVGQAERPSVAGSGTPLIPHQLPPVVADFVGRERELARIRRVLADGAERPGPTVVVLSGRPGVGKTTLAVRAGWQLRTDHPDGCLHADLTDRRGGPVDPYEVLGAFLRALGVADRAVPADRTERAALYRSVVADRRLLVLLDGADREEQVRPLLPSGPGSAALITASRPLPGLDGTHRIALDVLPVEPAVRLLRTMLPEPAAEDVSSARRVVQLCDGLPLAIRATANRLAVGPEQSLAQAAERLADSARRLDRLVAGDHDVRRGLAGAYQRLTPPAATLLRRLGSLPVADFPGWLAVPLLDVDQATADLALAELLDAGLVRVEPGGTGGLPRYRMPELVRLYARERVDSDDPPPVRATAFRRAYWLLLDLTLHADRQVPGQLFPAGDLGTPEGFGPPAELLDAVDADPVGWLGTERRLVVAAAAHASTLGDTEVAWRLAVAPTNFCQLRGLTDSWRRALGHGRTALRNRPGPARAEALLSLSQALLELSEAESGTAWATAGAGRRLFRELDDPARVAACAAVQWMATHRMGPLDPVTVEPGPARRTGDDLGALASSRAAARAAGAARRAAPAPRSGDQPDPADPRRSGKRPPEVVPVLAGKVGTPDSGRTRGE